MFTKMKVDNCILLGFSLIYLLISCEVKIPRNDVLIRGDKKVVFEEEVEEIELQYYGMMCSCPQWATRSSIDVYERSLENDTPIEVDSLFIIIEPNEPNIANPLDLNYGSMPIFKFIGRYSKRRHKWTNEEGLEYNSMIFRYSHVETAK